jgi:hypothetical protein
MRTLDRALLVAIAPCMLALAFAVWPAHAGDLGLANGAIGCIDKKEAHALMALNKVGQPYKKSGVSDKVVDYLRHVNGVTCMNLSDSTQVTIMERSGELCPRVRAR